jgi:hypothetical protein
VAKVVSNESQTVDDVESLLIAAWRTKNKKTGASGLLVEYEDHLSDLALQKDDKGLVHVTKQGAEVGVMDKGAWRPNSGSAQSSLSTALANEKFAKEILDSSASERVAWEDGLGLVRWTWQPPLPPQKGAEPVVKPNDGPFMLVMMLGLGSVVLVLGWRARWPAMFLAWVKSRRKPTEPETEPKDGAGTPPSDAGGEPTEVTDPTEEVTEEVQKTMSAAHASQLTLDMTEEDVTEEAEKAKAKTPDAPDPDATDHGLDHTEPPSRQTELIELEYAGLVREAFGFGLDPGELELNKELVQRTFIALKQLLRGSMGAVEVNDLERLANQIDHVRGGLRDDDDAKAFEVVAYVDELLRTRTRQRNEHKEQIARFAEVGRVLELDGEASNGDAGQAHEMSLLLEEILESAGANGQEKAKRASAQESLRRCAALTKTAARLAGQTKPDSELEAIEHQLKQGAEGGYFEKNLVPSRAIGLLFNRIEALKERLQGAEDDNQALSEKLSDREALIARLDQEAEDLLVSYETFVERVTDQTQKHGDL